MVKKRATYCLCAAFQVAVGLVFLWGATSQSGAATDTWLGGGIDNHWTTPGNWQGGVAPSLGDNLSFPWASGATSNFNSYASGTTFGQISIGGGSPAPFSSYAIGGNRVVLTNGFAFSGPSLLAGLFATVDFDMTLGANQTFSANRSLTFNNTVDLNSHSLYMDTGSGVTFNGTLTNSSLTGATLSKTNTGTLTISSTAQIAPVPQSSISLVIAQGSVVMNGAANNASFYIGQGSLLLSGTAKYVDLESTSANLSGTGSTSNLFASAGIIRPGLNGAPGILKCGGFSSGAVGNFLEYDVPDLQIAINGTTPGTGYSQLQVNANYELTPYDSVYQYLTALSVQLTIQGSYAPQIGDSFVILKHTSGAPYQLKVNGMFFGLSPNGICEDTNGYSFAVTYDTNGVSLMAIRAPGNPFILWKGSQTNDSSFYSAYASRLWSSSNNWSGGILPTNGNSQLQFTPHQLFCYDPNFNQIPVPPLTNDFASGMAFASLYFSDTNYVLFGNAVTISEGITNDVSDGTNFCYLDLITTGPLAVDVDTGGTLLLDDSFNGSGTVSKEGGGTLRYLGSTMNSYVGSVVVDNGTMQVDGTFLDGSFTVNGGLLKGTGTVTSVTLNGGTLKAGDSPGILHMQGDLMMTAGAVFEAELNGPTPGNGYGQLQVNGAVTLNGATLNLLPGYNAAPGTAFIILVNDGTDPIVGTFAGLREGTIFQANGQYFSISYKAGSGSNDVIVTRVNPPGNLSGIARLDPSTIQLQGTGGTNATYTIQANTNLATTNWSIIGTASANGSGVFFFNDTNAALFPQRFFRVQVP